VIDTTIINVALPSIQADLAFTDASLVWVVNAYMVTYGGFLLLGGRLGDLYGNRRWFLLGTALFTVASLVCALANTQWLLVAARAVQGLGAAVMMALTMASVSEAVPKERSGSAMGVLGTMSAVGTALGPTLGGVLIAAWGWRAVFLINVPLGLLALVLVARHLPADRPPQPAQRPRFDHAGSWLLVLTLAAYALAMTVGRGSFTSSNLALLGAALLGLGAFVRVEARTAAPLVRLALFRVPLLRAGFGMSALTTTVAMTTLVVGPFHLSRTFGLDAAHVGLVMSTGPLVAALAGVPAGRGVDRFGAPRMMLAGLAGMAAGCIALTLTPAAWGVAGYIVPLVTLTAGFALFQAANNTAVMAAIAPEQKGVVSGLLSLSRNLGLITGASVMGAVYAAGAARLDVALPGEASSAAGLRLAFAVAAALVGVALALASAGLPRDVRRPSPN
jgi:EmrB/QacA subfamily drug resistance transporter